jgi:hypothetical protein
MVGYHDSDSVDTQSSGILFATTEVSKTMVAMLLFPVSNLSLGNSKLKFAFTMV